MYQVIKKFIQKLNLKQLNSNIVLQIDKVRRKKIIRRLQYSVETLRNNLRLLQLMIQINIANIILMMKDLYNFLMVLNIKGL